MFLPVAQPYLDGIVNAGLRNGFGSMAGDLQASLSPTDGLLAAFAGILYSGHYGSISATQGSGWIFQVFAATVIGGVSLNGGKGSVFGALTGVLTLQLVVNVMTLAGVPPLWNQFLNGAIIIVALIISRFASGEKQE